MEKNDNLLGNRLIDHILLKKKKVNGKLTMQLFQRQSAKSVWGVLVM